MLTPLTYIIHMEVVNADIAGAIYLSILAMALVLIKSNSAGFFVQISSQNRETIVPHQIDDS